MTNKTRMLPELFGTATIKHLQAVTARLSAHMMERQRR